jgi:hypothetical protein
MIYFNSLRAKRVIQTPRFMRVSGVFYYCILPASFLFYVPYLNRKDKNQRPAVSRAVYVVNLCRGLFQTEVTTKTAQEPPKNSKVIYE